VLLPSWVNECEVNLTDPVAKLPNLICVEWRDKLDVGPETISRQFVGCFVVPTPQPMCDLMTLFFEVCDFVVKAR
jgi:hypothetical protein